MVLPRISKPATESPVKRRPLRAQRPAVRAQKPPKHVQPTAPKAIRAMRIARVDPMLARQPPTKLASALGLKPMRPPRDKSPHRKNVLPPVGQGRHASSSSRIQHAQAWNNKCLPPINNRGSKRAVSTPPVASSVPSLPRIARPPRKRPQVATTKASGMRAAIIRRQAAETALRSAAARRDVVQLESSIANARVVGVSASVIKEVEHVLAASRRMAAEFALRKAMDSDWPDLEHLMSCIDSAKQYSVSKVIITEGEDMLPRLQESAKQRRAAEAIVALCSAMNSRNPVEIAKCITAARMAEAADVKIQHAESFLLRLREDLAVEARRKDAVASLQDSINSRSLSRLPDSIQKARDAEVEVGLLQNAELLLSTLRFESALRDAIRSKNIEHLESFITSARSEGLQKGVARNLVAEAELVLGDCLEEIERRKRGKRAEADAREQAEAALCAALVSQSREGLRSCLDAARKAGLTSDEIGDAERVLGQLQENIVVQRSARQSHKKLASALAQANNDGRLGTMLEQVWKHQDESTPPELQVSFQDMDFLTFGLTETSEKPTVVEAAPSAVTGAIEKQPEMDSNIVVQIDMPDILSEELPSSGAKTRPLSRDRCDVQDEIVALRVANSALKLQLELQASKTEESMTETAPVQDNSVDVDKGLAMYEMLPAKAPRTSQLASQVADSIAAIGSDIPCKTDEGTLIQRVARRDIALSYVRGSLNSTLEAAFTQRPDFERVRQMTRDMIHQALGNGKFVEALQLTFDDGA